MCRAPPDRVDQTPYRAPSGASSRGGAGVKRRAFCLRYFKSLVMSMLLLVLKKGKMEELGTHTPPPQHGPGRGRDRAEA